MQVFLTGATLAFLTPLMLVWINPGMANVKIWLSVVTLLWLVVWRYKHRLSGALQEAVPTRTLAILAAAALILFAARGALDYQAFKVSGLDFSVFDLALYNSAHGRFMWTPMCDCNHFGIHPTYILLPLIGVYAVMASPWTLIILHAVATWSAALPLWHLARRHLPSDALAALVLVAYFSNPWVGSIVGYGFHMEVFYLPAGLWFLWGWTNNRPWIWITSLIVFLSVKEDSAFYMAAFSLYSLWQESARRLAAAAILIASLTLFCVNSLVVQPHFQTPGEPPSYLTFWAPYGHTLGEIAKTMLTSPWRVMKDVLTSQWYLMFGSALFLPLLAPHAVVAMLPAMVILGTSAVSPMRHYGLYYSAPLIPFFFWGLVTSYSRLAKRFAPQKAALIFAGATLLLPFTRNGSIILTPPRSELSAELQDIIDTHPDFDRPVCAQLSLVPHLPYSWDVKRLSAECLGLPGAVALGHAGLSPYPYDTATISGFFAGSTPLPAGLLVRGW